jgi:hypothetical protein
VSDPLRDPWRSDAPQYRLELFPSAEVQARILAALMAREALYREAFPRGTPRPG